MSLKESNMISLGTDLPKFSLPDTVSGKTVTQDDYKNMTLLVVMFICNHCPYVIHVNDEIIRIAEEYEGRNVGFVAISSNDVENYPQDGPELMKKHAARCGYPFVYLYDESQDVARAFDAACTPDFYVFDSQRKLAYRGRLDASRPGNEEELTGKDLREALDHLLVGSPVLEPHYPSAGCNIKWKQ